MQPTPDNLLQMAAERTGSGRNKAGFWLAQQLHANQYPQVDAEEIMRRFARSVPQTAGKEPYTEHEALVTLKEEYKRTAKKPWDNADPQQQRRESSRDRQRRALAEACTINPKNQAEASPESRAALKHQLATLQPLSDSPAEAYLKTRGIPRELAKACGVKYCPSWGRSDKWDGQPAAVFPIRDPDGRLQAAQGRATAGDSKITYGSKALGVFATPNALECDPVAITEAPIDALSLAAAGCPAIATVGISWPEWLKKLLAFRVVFLATDSDPSGETAAAKMAAELTVYGARCVRLRPGLKDWNDVLRQHGPEAISQAAMAAYAETVPDEV